MRVIKELGDYRMAEGRYADAADAYRRALHKGLDSSYVKQRIQEYPPRGEYIK